MKKGIINTWSPYLLLMLATSMYGCEGCSVRSKGSPTKPISPTQTEINYAINLDEAKKIKQEGHKVYYEVPLNTEVIIVAKTTRPPTVAIDWEQNPLYPLGRKMTVSEGHSTYYKSTRNGRVVTEDSAGKMVAAWVFASRTPTCVTVTGKPHRIGQAHEQGNNILNNEKGFVITWT